MTPPTRPQFPGDPDPLDVQLQPVDDRIPHHPKPLPPARPSLIGPSYDVRGIDWFRVCILVGVVAACLLFWLGLWLLLAAPSSAPDPTAPPPGASGAIGSVDAPARAQASASGPELSGAPLADATASGAPQPAVELGTAVFPASATWCAPNYRTGQCLRWGGHALLGALPTYSGTPYVVRVWYGSRHVDVTVVSICGCGIDLSPFAFGKLAPLSRGRIDVEVEGPIGLPNTSTGGTP